MATQQYGTVDPRIGAFKGEVLAHAMFQEVLGRVGVSMKKTIPQRSSETIIFRRMLPKGGTTANPNTINIDPAAHRLNEGETPPSDTIGMQDIRVSLDEFGVLFRYSNRLAELYEDDVPSEMKRQVGERMGGVMEMVRYGVLRAGTNVFYPTLAVTSRSAVGGAASQLLSASALRRVARSLEANRATKVTQVLATSDRVDTKNIEASYIVALHTHLAADVRAQLGADFIHVSEYGRRETIHPNELGSWEQFRFVTSPELAPFLQQGGTFGTANTYLSNGAPNTGSNASDVYPVLIMGEECYGDVMLRGMDSFHAFMKTPKETSKDDPLGQTGYCGARVYFNAVRLNEQHMAILEVPASALA